MPRVCTVCAHQASSAINKALAASTPIRNLAESYGLSDQALIRHRDDHLPARIVKAQERMDVREAIDVVAQLKAINQASLAVLKDARDQRDGDLALKAIDRIQRQIELQAKLLGELDDRPQVNVLIAPEWLELRVQILTALESFPEARQAVIGAISERAG